ncbi:protein of unknown function DUF262 [Granulicella mallensis MP5ACTX8]|uniref:GmrSD restriction endonucleases N-terminal domain-containing protein n=2 Tax=Granulicella mallensis TaxID=940614 RepID=G8NQX0_GRAMM|nr:protein of unknown function DUF262 [Granulicella mallensis MP5ACTX8]
MTYNCATNRGRMPYEIETEELPLEFEDESGDEDVPMSYDIATYPSDFTLSGISQMWKDGDISIPDFQREFVWNIKQASLLIDSFLRGLPVPPVFFYIGDDNKNLVIDGQQRILSVVYFIEGYFGPEGIQGKRQVFRLKGLGEKSPFWNRRFVDLGSTDQRKLKQAVLRAVNIKQLSPVGNSTSAYHIFERLNTGGTPLTSQEIRNCVFMGFFSNQLKAANKDKNWRLILGKAQIDRHQKDTEILLRVFALVGNVDSYEKPMKEFLNKAMKENQSGDSARVKRFMNRLPDVLEMIIKAHGPKPFHIRGPLNASALDSVLCVLFENYGKITQNHFKTGYLQLLKDKTFQRYTQKGTTDAKTVQDRVALVRKYLMP